MIDHEDLTRLALKGAEMLDEPGLTGRVDPACFAMETRRMADTYIRLSAGSLGVASQVTALPGAVRAAIMDACEKAFRTGMAIGLAHHEEQMAALAQDRANRRQCDECDELMDRVDPPHGGDSWHYRCPNGHTQVIGK